MKILLVQTGFLGDTVLSTPVIAALKARYPDAELWLLTTTEARELVWRDPLISGVITFDKHGAEAGVQGLWRKARELRARGFARAYALHKSYRTALLLWLTGIPVRVGYARAALSFLYTVRIDDSQQDHDVLRRLSILSKEASPGLLLGELRLCSPEVAECTPAIASFLASKKPFVVVVPGSAWATKRWSKEGYRAVVDELIDGGHEVVLLGSAQEAALCQEVGEGLACRNFAGRTSIAEAMLLIERSALVICNDSVSLQIASAFKRPVVAIFCATVPAFGFGPWRTPAIVVEKNGLTCRPCGRHGGMRCPTGTQACMREVPAHEVLAAARRLLGDAKQVKDKSGE